MSKLFKFLYRKNGLPKFKEYTNFNHQTSYANQIDDEFAGKSKRLLKQQPHLNNLYQLLMTIEQPAIATQQLALQLIDPVKSTTQYYQWLTEFYTKSQQLIDDQWAMHKLGQQLIQQSPHIDYNEATLKSTIKQLHEQLLPKLYQSFLPKFTKQAQAIFTHNYEELMHQYHFKDWANQYMISNTDSYQMQMKQKNNFYRVKYYNHNDDNDTASYPSPISNNQLFANLYQQLTQQLLEPSIPTSLATKIKTSTTLTEVVDWFTIWAKLNYRYPKKYQLNWLDYQQIHHDLSNIEQQKNNEPIPYLPDFDTTGSINYKFINAATIYPNSINTKSINKPINNLPQLAYQRCVELCQTTDQPNPFWNWVRYIRGDSIASDLDHNQNQFVHLNKLTWVAYPELTFAKQHPNQYLLVNNHSINAANRHNFKYDGNQIYIDYPNQPKVIIPVFHQLIPLHNFLFGWYAQN